MSTLYVHISALFDARWERRTGIPRVEYEIARDLLGRGAKLITYSSIRRCFVAVDFETEIRPIILAQDGDLDSAFEAAPATKIGTAGGLARRALVPLAAGVGGHMGATVFALASPALTPSERRRVAGRMGLARDTKAAIRYLLTQSGAGAGSWADGVAALRPAAAVNFATGDVIFVPGIIWPRGPLAELARLRREKGVHIAAYVHDLIPVRRPEFHTDDTGVERYRHYLDTLMRCCSCLCVNSDFVADDLRAYARESGLEGCRVMKVGLCAGVTGQTKSGSTPRLAALSLASDNYALYVSTLNPRKNQTGAYLLWRRLQSMLGDGLPPLVFAGQRGWNSTDILRQMSRDKAMWGRHIHFVESPTEGELAHLYENCAFTLFPSLYEGWGLAITESLEFGKPCVAADNTALREAGQGLAMHIDDLDGPAWIAAVLRLIQNRPHREAVSANIKRHYQQRAWSDVGRELAAITAGLAANGDVPRKAAVT